MASPTTTTTVPPTPTTTAPPTPTNTAPPGSTTTTSATTDTSEVATSPTGTEPPPGGSSLAATLPGLPGDSGRADTISRQPTVLEAFGIELSPRLATFVATPLEIIAIIVATTFDAGSVVVVPAGILVGSAFAILIYERFRDRSEIRSLTNRM